MAKRLAPRTAAQRLDRYIHNVQAYSLIAESLYDDPADRMRFAQRMAAALSR